MLILTNDNIQHLLDSPATIRCPHCSVLSAMVPISIPRYQLMVRFNLSEVGISCRCSSCNRAVFLLHEVRGRANTGLEISDEFEQINVAVEPFETEYLSGAVLDDFNEALTCYSHSSWNAFAAMCRRCIQSVCAALEPKEQPKYRHKSRNSKRWV